MNFQDYRWEITPKSTTFLQELENLKLKLERLPLGEQQIINLRKRSFLKSAVYSARIEGFSDTEISPQLESQNLLAAYNYLYNLKDSTKLSQSLVRQLHSLALKNISDYAGEWRHESWAVFNESGTAIHVAPLHTLLPELMKNWISYVNSSQEHPAVKAAIAQFTFEKIHPFADGNGRVGRLISAFELMQGGYGLKGLTSFEEFIEKNRSSYYASLEPSHNVTLFIEFFLEALVVQGESSLANIESPNAIESSVETLPLRWQEIINILKNHPYSSFDFLSRRFQNIKVKTLHYDVGQLIKKGFIQKVGSTRGATYIAKS